MPRLTWPVGRWFLVALTVAAILSSAAAQLLAQVADTGAAVPPPDPQLTFVAGLGLISAVIAREVGSLVVSIWNRAGNWLDGKGNGFKQAIAVTVSGALGLAVNAVAGALTHSANWVVTLGLTIVLSTIGVVNAGVTIDAAKTKLLYKGTGTGGATPEKGRPFSGPGYAG